jgi:hypothetical protein
MFLNTKVICARCTKVGASREQKRSGLQPEELFKILFLRRIIMSEKLCFLICFVLVLGFSSPAAGDVFDDPNYNFSFEVDPCGDQILGHKDDMTRHAMAWLHNQDFAGMDVYCPNATATPTHCHDFPASDGIVYAYIQHNGTMVYQAFDPNYDPNGALLPGRMYTLKFDSLTETAGEATIIATFYYLDDVNFPDVPNQTDIASQAYVLPRQQGQEEYWQWSADLTLQLVWEDFNSPGNGKPLGIKFKTDAPGDYSFVDNIRLEWNYASFGYDPTPADGQENVALDANLSWTPGLWTDQHRVYLGTDLDAVTNRLEDVNQGLVDVNTFDPGALGLGKDYYWAIDEINDAYGGTEPPPGPWQGPVWRFSTVGFADNPSPADGAREVPLNVVLTWSAGAQAAQHDVYFGSDYSAVEDATTSSSEYRLPRLNLGNESYDAGANENLILGETYYWRIDELNNVQVKGRVWTFTIGDYQTVDDFDSYVNSEVLTAVWNDWSVNGSDATLTLEKDPNYVRDGNSANYYYQNTNKSSGKYIGSWIDTTPGDLGIVSDWASGEIEALVLYFHGKGANDAERMWVELEDTSSIVGLLLYDGDANDVKVEAWQEWNIDLAAFDACGVSLANIGKLSIGIGGHARTGQGAASTGTIYLEDIRLYPARCRAEIAYPSGDFSGDCVIDLDDMDIMATDWLVGDYATYGHTGYLQNYADDDTQWDGNGVINGALSLDQGAQNWVSIPDANWSGYTHMSFSAWVRPDGLQSNYCGIVYSREYGRGDASGLGYSKATKTAPQELNYNWNNTTWNWHSDVNIPEGQWSFVAAVVTPLLGKVYLHDGTSMTSSENAGSHDPLIQFRWDTDNGIGTDFFHKTFNGLIDDVRVYDYNLPESDVTNLASLGTDPNPGPIMWYRFDETSGLVAADSGYSTDPVYHPVPSIANLVDPESEYERYVNFRDFDIMAENWLKELMWPAP